MKSHTKVQSKLRGFKITAKEFRRNLLLKKHTNSQQQIDYLPQNCLISVQRQKMIEVSAQPSLYPQKDSNNDCNLNFGDEYKKYYYSSESNLHNTQNKRINEYLGVIYKKMQNDAEKILKTFTNENKNDPFAKIVKINYRQPSLNFIRRFKINSIKVRKKINNIDSCSVIIQHNEKFSINNAYEILGRLKKTEQSISHNKIKEGVESRKDKINYNSTNSSFHRQLKRQQIFASRNNKKQ